MARRGVDSDVGRFLTAHQHRLSRLAVVLTGDVGLAEDLVQDAMVKIVSKWSKVRASDDPVAYASRVVINQWRDTGRRLNRQRFPVGARTEDLVETDSLGRTVLDRIVMDEALTHLTVKQRAVLYLRFYEDRSVREVARILSCSEGNVKSQTSYALQQLSKVLPDREGEGRR